MPKFGLKRGAKYRAQAYMLCAIKITKNGLKQQEN